MLKDILGEISDSYERWMEKIDKLKSKRNDAS
ncbi:MAG: hypothetical protein RL154_1345 [Pseudomonadota bacterium]|jgi:hypothetical protein